MYREDLIKWWFNLDPLTNEEQTILKHHRSDNKEYDENTYTKYTDILFSKLYYSNITTNTHVLDVSDCATDFIKALFDKYVDDETLVIYSRDEHESVKDCVVKCKNTFELIYDFDIAKINIKKTIQEAKKYKKVFVYFIGTNISNGRVTAQLFFNTLKQALVENNIQHIFVLDDVHGMFMVPRDYNIFDYIIGTAHALVKRYDMGMLIHRKDIEGFGEHISNWLIDYIKALDVILKRKTKIQLFQNVMQEYFAEQLAFMSYTLVAPTSPHIFAIKTTQVSFTEPMYELLKKYYVRLEGKDGNGGYIRLRLAQCITDAELVQEGLDILEKLLKAI